MTPSLTILYTHNLRGDLQMLPRLATVLWQLKDDAVRQSDDADGKTLLLDLGGSCLPEVWPCGVTGGRSTLMVLDAMAYHAANVNGLLTAESRAKLVSRVSLAVLDEVTPSHEQDEVLLTIVPQTTDRLQVVVVPAEETTLVDHVLRLRGLDAGQVGVAKLAGDTVRAAIVVVGGDVQPDPTISGVVELVIEEARYYEQNRR
jgi:hypothetical protein